MRLRHMYEAHFVLNGEVRHSLGNNPFHTLAQAGEQRDWTPCLRLGQVPLLRFWYHDHFRFAPCAWVVFLLQAGVVDVRDEVTYDWPEFLKHVHRDAVGARRCVAGTEKAKASLFVRDYAVKRDQGSWSNGVRPGVRNVVVSRAPCEFSLSQSSGFILVGREDLPASCDWRGAYALSRLEPASDFIDIVRGRGLVEDLAPEVTLDAAHCSFEADACTLRFLSCHALRRAPENSVV